MILVWSFTALMFIAMLVIRYLSLSPRSIFIFDWYSLFLFFAFLAYVFPVLVFLAGVDFPAGSYVHLHPDVAESPVGAMLLAVFIVGSWTGYGLFSGRPLEKKNPRPVKQRLLVGFMVILASATVAWIVGFGGFRQAITSVMLIRMRFVASDSNATSFMQLTLAAWVVAVIALDAFFRARRSRGDFGTIVLSVALLGICGLALLLRGSRGAIASVLISVTLYIFARRRVPRADRQVVRFKVRKRTLLLVAVSAIAVVIALKPFMVFLEQAGTVATAETAAKNFKKDLLAGVSTEVEAGEATSTSSVSVLGRIASEFVHYALLSPLAFDYDRTYPFERNYGQDLIIAFGKLLPAIIYEPEGYMLSYRSTFLILEVWDSQVPPGIIAWLLLSGGPAFLVVGSLFCGIFLAVTERISMFLLRRSWWRESGYIAFGLIFAGGVLAGTPSDLVRMFGTVSFVLIGAIAIGSAIAAFVDVLPRRKLAPKALSAQ